MKPSGGGGKVALGQAEEKKDGRLARPANVALRLAQKR